ncbi:hypothetical protein INT48_003019 [Thamnidium elegans]|uniref:HTH CENPB-type domain-containing protein n=1 Tax=Thamnidium elegans TaxID=101142 RepID=A0A8H7SK30_9FUNG|nr:hypothetical protein INT48_003019 [Thamnidium elegans]
MEICAQHDTAIGFISQAELRKWAQQQFNLPVLPSQALISHILKNKQIILERGKVKSTGKSSKTTELVQLEQILLEHIQTMASKDIQLNGTEIRDYAELISNQLEIKKKFKFSNGWLQNFRQRHQLKRLDKHTTTLSTKQYTETITDTEETAITSNSSDTFVEFDEQDRKNNELIDALEKVLLNMSPDTDEEVIFAITASKMLYKLKSNIVKNKIKLLEEEV